MSWRRSSPPSNGSDRRLPLRRRVLAWGMAAERVPSSRSRRPSSFRVAIALPHSIPFVERLLVGVAGHARAAGWSFVRLPERIDTSLDWLQGWDGDGVLAAVETQRDENIARHLPIPVVNIVASLADQTLPLVTMDHQAVGRLAAKHLRERSFTSLAFYGVVDRPYSRLRCQGFTAALADEGLTPRVLEAQTRSPRAWQVHQRLLERWVADLPTSTGVFACTDERAVEILEVCRRLGRRVPEDLAVIGVDDDPVLCEFAQPSLTSIIRDDQAAGRAAAALLQRLMEAQRRGLPPPEIRPEIIIPPVGVVERRSTAIYAVRHPQVAALLERIQARYQEPVDIPELIAGLPLARRRLESLFREELGCSPYQFVLRQRLRRARELMAREDGMTLTAIADASGFASLRHLRVALGRTKSPNQES